MTNGLDLDGDPAVGFFVIAADMGKGRIAAKHLAAAHVHHAAADRVVELEPDLVEAFKQWPSPANARRCLARFITQGNGLEAAYLKLTCHNQCHQSMSSKIGVIKT